MNKEQQALDKMAENASELGLDCDPTQCKWPTCQSEEYQQALAEQIKRELVGEPEPAPLRDAIVANLVREGINKHRARELADHFIGLAALQPAQRPWVGLKADQLRVILDGDHTRISLALEIEAKLKEKNT